MPRKPKKTIRAFKAPVRGAFSRYLKHQVDSEGKNVLKSLIDKSEEEFLAENTTDKNWKTKGLTPYEKAMQRWHEDAKKQSNEDLGDCA